MQLDMNPLLAARLRQHGGFTYLASPITKYAAGPVTAALHAARAAASLVAQGVVVFCPAAHGNALELTGHLSHFKHDDWMRQCAPLVGACSVLAVLMLPGWDESSGVRQEITWAKARDLPVIYLPTNDE